MKILVFSILLFTSITFAQKSEYNAKKTLSKIEELGTWRVGDMGIEMYVNKNTPVGIFQTYKELNRVLEFYNLKYENPDHDESLISSLCEGDKDWEMLSITSKSERTIINKAWFINGYIVMYNLGIDFISVSIFFDNK